MNKVFSLKSIGIALVALIIAIVFWKLARETSAQRNAPIRKADPASAPSKAVVAPDDVGSVLLNARHIDVRSHEAQSERRSVEGFSGKRLHLVRFIGPIRSNWVRSLTDAGVEIVDYIPHYTYLVYGDAFAINNIQSKAAEATSPIEWDGPFKDEYKVQPSVRFEPKVDKGREGLRSDQFRIQLIKDDEANAETLRLIESIRSGDVKGLQTARHFVNVVVGLNEEGIASVAKRPDVVSIYPYSEPRMMDERLNLILRGNLNGNDPTPGDYLTYLASKGFSQAQFDASNFIVDVTDSGVDNATPANPNQFLLRKFGDPAGVSRFAYSRILGTQTGTAQGCDGHGNLNATIVAGYVPTGGIFAAFPHADTAGYRYGLGVAPFVKVGSSTIFSPSYTNPNFADLQSMAYNDGARISTNSWGSTSGDGAYDSDAQAYDALVRDAQPASSTNATAGNQEMVMIFSAGNDGPGAKTVAPPGSGKNMISVGASENVHPFGGSDFCGTLDLEANSAMDVVGFSSRGPAADGRIKPDIMLPGTHVTGGAAQASNISPVSGNGVKIACFNANGVCGGVPPSDFFPAGQQWYTASSGTSHSTPAIAGFAALIRQHFINRSLSPPSPAMTKALIMNSAEYMTGSGANDNLPSNSQGMGLADMDRYFDFSEQPKIYRDQAAQDTFTDSGQQRIFTGTVNDSSKPFRVTLAWTDAPGSTTGNAYVNNLDLEVTVAGTSYKGNVFNGSNSTAGGAADVRNNVESVYVPAGVSGAFLVKVKGLNIAGDGLPGNADPTDQDFVLLVSNASESPQPVIEHTGISIVSESGNPPNGAPDPGESLTVSFTLRNVGTSPSSTIVVSLGTSGGILNPSGPQNLGVLAAGESDTRFFTFNVPHQAPCGGTVTLNFHVFDENEVYNISKDYKLGTQPGGQSSFSNSAVINIPAGQPGSTVGPASPYAAGIDVSGLSGSKAISVELTGNNHKWGSDIDVMLEGPGGQKFIIMSDAFNASNRAPNTVTATMTIRDDASANMPASTAWTATGDFRPTNFAAADTFTAPAPSAPYQNPAPAGNATFTSVFGSDGASMNGMWKLWIIDDESGDSGVMQGWKIKFDSLDYVCSEAQSNAVRADFDGDSRTDLSVYRPSEGNWYLAQSTDGFKTVGWGLNGDKIQPGDFDADGRTDFGVFRPSNNTWYEIESGSNTIVQVAWGLAGDIPVSGHYRAGQSKDEPAVWRPSTGRWYIHGSTYIEIAWGLPGDLPVPADYNGDGATDFGVYRPSEGRWYVLFANGSVITVDWGLSGDRPVPADYDGDNKDDFAVWRPSNGRWYIAKSANGVIEETWWGLNGDIPVPGDFDGDGTYDKAVYRPTEGRWYQQRTNSGIFVFDWGLPGDVPAPEGYIPKLVP